MYEKLDYNISKIKQENNSTIYKIDDKKCYIISNLSTRQLLGKPELVGYDICEKLLVPIKDMLCFFKKEQILSNINVVNILRGGLNFPIERACFTEELNVEEVSFLTSERIFVDDKVSRIESKYRKIADVPDATIILGDIIASGETLYNTIKYITEEYINYKNKIKKIIIFTIGTNNAITLIQKLEKELKALWKEFEGIHIVFFEAVFTTYFSSGITGLNLPYVDFTFKNGILAPEYRKILIENPYTIFEKCAIYDGGARRFEKKIHINTILKYWNDLYLIADKISLQKFYNEKMGDAFLNLEDWINLNNYKELDKKEIASLYFCEKDYFEILQKLNLKRISGDRYEQLISYYSI